MGFSSLHSESDDDFEGQIIGYRQPQAGLLLQQFNDSWINNNWDVEERWFDEYFRFVTPLFTLSSFMDFSGWFEKVLPSINSAEITHQYSSDQCTCCIVDAAIGGQSSILRIAQLVTFENNRIVEIEWIYDPREVFDLFSGAVAQVELA
jgi:hypothetical protein